MAKMVKSMSKLSGRKTIATVHRAVKRFNGDTRGNVALLFGLMATVLFMAIGGSLDFARAYMARQKLSQIATLACQYASRPAIASTSTSSYGGSNGGTTYVNNVNNFITTTWQTQKVNLTQTNAVPFTYTPGGAADVSLTASMPALFIQMFGINNVGVGAQSHCYDSVNNTPPGGGQFLIKEGFEATPNGRVSYWAPYQPNGQSYLSPTPSSSYSSAVAYTGSGGTQWHVIGYCLEQDVAGTNIPTVQEGTYTVELDCDSGPSAGLKGNSSISTQQYLPVGQYELRYFYSGRVHYPNYDPTYLCGSAASDMSWANDTNSLNGYIANALRTNQINVYLDQNNASTNAPPLHSTLDGQALGGSNLIDMCVYSPGWIERSVTINVTTAGYYWLSFAADGTSDSNGGQLDNIRLCRVSCPGSVQDNFPTAWTAGKTLFEDTFESMTTYLPNSLYGFGDISTSKGTSGSASSGWPNQTAAGWRISQVNELNTVYYQPVQGTTSIELDGDGNIAGVANSNRTITRPFLLDPGYYRVTYNYRSNVSFASVGTSVYCGATPSAANVSALSGSGIGLVIYSYGYTNNFAYDTNMIGAFMSHDQLASDPNYAAYNSVATYNNPDGSNTSNPSVPDNGINTANYNSAQVNPLLDICGYAAAWQTRTANVFIPKPGNYWLTFAALGTADNLGGSIDDVKLTALGSPYMSSPPSGAVSIPVPDPQPGATISYTGFTIKADPIAP